MVGSTKLGRDSASKRLGVKKMMVKKSCLVKLLFGNEGLTMLRVSMLGEVVTILYMLSKAGWLSFLLRGRLSLTALLKGSRWLGWSSYPQVRLTGFCCFGIIYFKSGNSAFRVYQFSRAPFKGSFCYNLICGSGVGSRWSWEWNYHSALGVRFSLYPR